jgi:hypothetical protein
VVFHTPYHLMKKKFVVAGLCAALLAMWTGCSTPTSKRLNQLELGMTQAKVKKILGDNYIAKASRTDASGALLQLWEYRDTKTDEVYRIFFKDGQLAQWGGQDKLEFPELNLRKQ